MKRTFFAVKIHPGEMMAGSLPDIRGHLTGEKIRWIPVDQLHLTLKFLGETPEDIIQDIITTVSGQLCAIPAMTLHLSGVGLFKNLHNPRVIWIGMKPCASLHQAWQYLNDNLLPFGFPAEDKEFRPHLTLGRVKEIRYKEKLNTLIEKYKNISFGTVSVTEILFYESILKPEGPDYIPLMRFPLQ
ncbi:MAG: RNA 2',3'-cyclic phosphodiesterase [Bacteroidales bacterium]|nr:RNA 2',3'-cyclic phosphodiesterase [Bacteroidales bacterium]